MTQSQQMAIDKINGSDYKSKDQNKVFVFPYVRDILVFFINESEAFAEADKSAAILAADQAKQKLDEAEKKLKVSDSDVAIFKTLFTSMQNTVVELQDLIIRINDKDPDTASKLCSALKTFVSEVIDKQLCLKAD